MALVFNYNSVMYITVPCSRLEHDHDDLNVCFVPIPPSNQICTTCCRNQDCGPQMPLCSLVETDPPTTEASVH